MFIDDADFDDVVMLVIASVVGAAAGTVAFDQTAAREDWDETAAMTKILNHDGAPLSDQFFHVEWSAAAGHGEQDDITGFIYNDAGNAAVNVELRIIGLNSRGEEAADVVRPVGGAVPGFGRAYFDVHVLRSPSYRVAVTSFDFVVPRGGQVRSVGNRAALVFSARGLLSSRTGPTYSYSKAGADVAEFRQDSYACVQEPRMSWGASGSPVIGGASIDGKRQASKLYRMCMEANGWTAEAPR